MIKTAKRNQRTGRFVSRSLTERFWENVDKRGPDDCWEWMAGKEFGYGYIRREGHKGKMARAHRVAWELTNGPIPKGMCVLHRYDNPGCCNPAHLWLGTLADNNADMAAKGRHAVKYKGVLNLLRDRFLACLSLLNRVTLKGRLRGCWV